MSKNILLHVGYHKTGTTWTQRIYFQPGFGYVPLINHDQVWEIIVDPHAFAFDAARAREAITALSPAVPEDMVPVISSEILTGHPFYGAKCNVQTARRLLEMYPDGRILITIREQVKIIASIYMQYIVRGGTRPMEEFFAEESLPGYDHFMADNFCYHHLVGFYRELFGPDRVLVLTQEQMASDLGGYLKQLAVFAESPVQGGLPASATREGLSYPEGGAPALRRVNHLRCAPASPEPMINTGAVGEFLYRSTGKLSRMIFARESLASHRPVTGWVAERFGERFGESNRALKEMLGDGIDLSRYRL